MILSKIIEKVKTLLKNKHSDYIKNIDILLINIKNECFDRFSLATNEIDLRFIRAEILGKTGPLTSILRMMNKVPSDRKREMGEKINTVRAEIEAEFDSRLNKIHLASE